MRERGCEALLFAADAKGHPREALKGEHRKVGTHRVLPLRSSLRSFNAKRTLWKHELFTAPPCKLTWPELAQHGLCKALT